MSSPRYWAVIPAAGIGSRMGADVPKQYLRLGSRAVIDHAVERILLHPLVDGLYIALRDGDRWWSDTEFADHPDLVRVTGGAERSDSVRNALLVLAERAEPDDWVLVHDAARPCVRREDVTRLIELAGQHTVGGLLGHPVRDTMKRVDADAQVIETLDRAVIWHAFTPQMFRLGELLEALNAAAASGVVVTDEASAMEAIGRRPLMVEGAADNLKITRPDDLALAGFALSQQPGR